MKGVINMNVVMYSTGCPKCKILKKKLDEKKVAYEEETDVEKMKSKGIDRVPVLEVDGKLFSYSEAVKLVNDGGI